MIHKTILYTCHNPPTLAPMKLVTSVYETPDSFYASFQELALWLFSSTSVRPVLERLFQRIHVNIQRWVRKGISG